MTQVDAVFQNGVFRPLTPVALPENQQVKLQFQPVNANDMLAWLEKAARVRQEFVDQHGFLPDSTPDIAEDRRR